MNIDNEPAALLALMHKYKSSPQEFVLARMAAKVDVIEIMMVELSASYDAAKRVRLADQNSADFLKLTEQYLAFFALQKDARDEGEPLPGNN